jgi:D-xylose transport system permease protein
MSEDSAVHFPSVKSAVPGRAAPGWVSKAADLLSFRFVPVLLSLLLIAAFFTLQEPLFLSPRNLSNLSIQVTVTGTLAVGVVLVLLLGEIDLSVGSVMGASAAALGAVNAFHGWPWWAACLLALAFGTCSGAFQGAWRAFTGVPSFVVTLAGYLAFFGVQQHILGSEGTINVFDDHIAALTASYIPFGWGWFIAGVAVIAYAASAALPSWKTKRNHLAQEPRAVVILLKIAGVSVAALGSVVILNSFQGVPTALVIFVAVVLLFDVLTKRTQFGRHIYAVGGNPEAARRAGIHLNKMRIAVFALTGLLAGVAGILAVSRNQAAGTLTGGGTQLLEAIAAAVIGGTSLFGGRGTAWAALFGALVIGSVSNGMELIGQPPDVKFITQGAILLIAVTVDAFSRRRDNSRS